MNLIAQIEAEQIAQLGKSIPDFKAGDTLRIGYKVTEGSRARVQNFEGVCISRKNGKGISASFTVRKISFGEGVERVFPLYSTNIENITVVRRGRVRRAKLYYLRARRGKSARIAEDTNYRELTLTGGMAPSSPSYNARSGLSAKSPPMHSVPLAPLAPKYADIEQSEGLIETDFSVRIRKINTALRKLRLMGQPATLKQKVESVNALSNSLPSADEYAVNEVRFRSKLIEALSKILPLTVSRDVELKDHSITTIARIGDCFTATHNNRTSDPIYAALSMIGTDRVFILELQKQGENTDSLCVSLQRLSTVLNCQKLDNCEAKISNIRLFREDTESLSVEGVFNFNVLNSDPFECETFSLSSGPGVTFALRLENRLAERFSLEECFRRAYVF